MARIDSSKRVSKLLDAVRADFPRRKAAAETLMRQVGLEETFELTVTTPEKARFLPTFDRNRRRRFSPMLKARFEYAGTIGYGGDTWLSPAQMARWMRKRRVRSYHEALREHYDGSAPNLFRDEDLTLFIVTEGVPQNLTYLVWRASNNEPKILSYVGMETYEFEDLAGYLSWVLHRE